ncbi:MAG: hypothetical protein WBD75_01935 [Phycisphaerae bacterium]
MKAAEKRLEKVEASLTPKQQILRWLDQVHGFQSEDKYCEWLKGQPASELPRVRMVEAAGDAARRAMRGEPAEVIERATRNAERDVIFLTELVLQLNTLVDQKGEVFSLRAALLARALQLAILSEVAGADSAVAAVMPNPSLRLSEIREETERLLGEICVLQGTVEIIRRRYFDGRPMVFPRKAAYLKAVWGAACALGCEYNRLVAHRSPSVEADGAEGGKPEDAPAAPGVIDMEAVQAKAAAVAAAEARFCVYLAKAEALALTGRIDEAVSLLKACAAGKERQSGPGA